MLIIQEDAHVKAHPSSLTFIQLVPEMSPKALIPHSRALLCLICIRSDTPIRVDGIAVGVFNAGPVGEHLRYASSMSDLVFIAQHASGAHSMRAVHLQERKRYLHSH